MIKSNNSKPLTIRSLLFEIAYNGHSIKLERLLAKYKNNIRRFNICLKYLIKMGYINQSSNDSVTYSINRKGRKKILKYNIDDLKIDRTQKWDHKWRLVIFDIPEDEKAKRNILTRKLKDIGFVSLQKSVLIQPYKCYKEADFLRKAYDLEKYVRILTLENTDDAKSYLWEYYKTNHEDLTNYKNKDLNDLIK